MAPVNGDGRPLRVPACGALALERLRRSTWWGMRSERAAGPPSATFFSTLANIPYGGRNCLPRRKFMAYDPQFPEDPRMTMLDRMRRHRNWLKWSLGIVCLAFVIFYIPDFLSRPAGNSARDRRRRGRRRPRDPRRRVPARRIRRRSRRIARRTARNMNEQLLRQLGIDQQILQQMVDERAALAEADRLGIEVSDAGGARSASARSRRSRRTACSSASSGIGRSRDAASADDAVASSKRACAARWSSKSCERR